MIIIFTIFNLFFPVLYFFGFYNYITHHSLLLSIIGAIIVTALSNAPILSIFVYPAVEYFTKGAISDYGYLAIFSNIFYHIAILIAVLIQKKQSMY